MSGAPIVTPPKGGDGSDVVPGGEGPIKGGRRKTAWMTHVKATMRAHKGLKLKQVLKLAKKTYKKTAKRGGGAIITPFILGGQEGARRRRRGSTRRSRRGGDVE